jgi:hypothetical protein
MSSTTAINTTTLTVASRRTKIVTDAVVSAYIHEITRQQAPSERVGALRPSARSRRGITHTPARGRARNAAQRRQSTPQLAG